MLGNIETTSHLKPEIDPNPGLTVEQKRNLVIDFITAGATFDHVPSGPGFREYTLHEPPLRGLILNFTLSSNNKHLHKQALGNMRGEDPEPPQGDMHIKEFDLGDDSLYGQGFGTALLRRGLEVAYADFPLLAGDNVEAEDDPRLTLMSTGTANLLLLNTMAKVGGGSENVTARMHGITYGQGGQQPIQQALASFDKERRLDKNYRYLFHDVEVTLDPAQLMLDT